MTRDERKLFRAVRAQLTPELLRPSFRGRPENPFFGHCYHATEALYLLLGGKQAGYMTHRGVDQAGIPHYWITSPRGAIIDPTADQYTDFGQEPPYQAGRRVGFQQLSRSAKMIISRINPELIP